MRFAFIAAAALTAITIALSPPQVAESAAQSQESDSHTTDKAELRQFMRAKMAMVHKIVDGIATEDFRLIRDGGMELAALSTSARWKSPKDPYYQNYSAGFEHAVKHLIDAADSESLEKVTFAYIHVTVSCTACHQHVRGTVRVAQ
ncbi:MAG: hypothetical protein R3C19_14605 [Planctomycetaceae bacterium]